ARAPFQGAHRLFETARGRRAPAAISIGLGVGFERRQVGIENGGGAIDRSVDRPEMRLAHPSRADRDGVGLVVGATHNCGACRLSSWLFMIAFSGRSKAQMMGAGASAIAAMKKKNLV